MLDLPSDSGNSATGRTTHPIGLLLLLGPALLVIVILFGGGLFLGLVQVLGYDLTSTTKDLTFSNFINIFSNPDFGTSLAITLYISVTSTVVAACVSIGLALLINNWATKSKIIHFLLQIPLTVPHLVIAISVMFLLAPAGLVSRLCSSLGILETGQAFPLFVNDTYGIGILLVYIWKEIPFITFMLLVVLKNVGTELLEVGATLNCTKFQRFYHITLPLIAPSLGAACCIVFAFTFGAFEVPYLLGRTYPLTLPVWAYKNYSDVDLVARPEGIGLGLIIAVIVIGAIVVSQILLQFGRKRGV